MKTQNWVRREIDWLLQSSLLSLDDEQFLKKIACKRFWDLTDGEILRLAELQGGAR